MPAAAEFEALGCTARVVAADGAALDTARDIVDQVVQAIDASCSRFRSDSELTALEPATGRWTHLSPLLARALAAALRVAHMTDGAVDPTVGEAMRAIGYDRDFELMAARSEPMREESGPVPGWRSVELDEARLRIRLRPGVRLDLGASAKALAADEAAAAAAHAVRGGVLVSLGGDVAVAGAPPAGGWRILVGEDHRMPLDAPGPVVTLAAGGLATSSTMVRRWVRGDRDLHHIVDPATGLPVVPFWRTVTVAASTCLDANAAATASIVWGERATGFLSRHALPARLVRADGTVVRCGGWPSSEEAA